MLPVCGVLAAVLLAGCSAPAEAPKTAPAPSAGASAGAPAGASAGAPAGASAVDEPPGTLACHKIGEAARAGSLMQPGVVTDVTRSTATADAPVADAAGRLQEAYERAVRAQGSENEPDLVAAVSAAAAEMVSVCADSGLETAG